MNGSAESDAGVRSAAREAMLHHEPITVMHAVPEVTVDSRDLLLRGWIRKYPDSQGEKFLAYVATIIADAAEAEHLSPMHRRLCRSGPVPALVDASRDARMVVVGSRGSRRFSASCRLPQARVWCITRAARSP